VIIVVTKKDLDPLQRKSRETLRYIKKQTKKGEFARIRFETFQKLSLNSKGRTDFNTDKLQISLMDKDYTYIDKITKNIRKYF